MAANNWDWFDCENKSARYRYVQGLRKKKEDVKADRSALGKVAHVIHTHVKSRDIPIQLVKACGSVGKNTDSSKFSDLDLVIFIDNLEPSQISKRISKILDKIQEAMDQQYPNTRDTDWYRKFGLRYFIAPMEIDILIGCPTVKPKDFLTVIEDAEQRAFMSASASRYATNFMKKQGLLFKDLVRVAKDWRDSYVWPNQCKPKSYLLEVLMLHACRTARPRFFSKRRNAVLQTVPATPNLVAFFMLQFFKLIGSIEKYKKGKTCNKNSVSPCIFFDTYYKEDDIPWDQPEPLFRQTIKKGNKTRMSSLVSTLPTNHQERKQDSTCDSIGTGSGQSHQQSMVDVGGCQSIHQSGQTNGRDVARGIGGR